MQPNVTMIEILDIYNLKLVAIKCQYYIYKALYRKH